MSFPTKIIPLFGGSNYAPLNHDHDGRYALINHTHPSIFPDWKNMIIIKCERTIHYNSSGSSWNTSAAAVGWGDGGILNGNYYEYKINGTVICKLFKDVVKSVYVAMSGTTEYNARRVTLSKDCYVHFNDGDNPIGLYRNATCVRQIQAGRPNDVGGVFLFCKSGDMLYARTDAHLLTITPLM